MDPYSVIGHSMTMFAAEGDPVSASDWQSVITSITTQINVSTVVGVLASVAAAAVGLVFMWWGVRKAVKVLMSAFKKGKLRV